MFESRDSYEKYEKYAKKIRIIAKKFFAYRREDINYM